MLKEVAKKNNAPHNVNDRKDNVADWAFTIDNPEERQYQFKNKFQEDYVGWMESQAIWLFKGEIKVEELD